MPTHTTLEPIVITPDQTIVLVSTDEDGEGAGTMLPYALATSVEITDGRLTVLAGADVLDVHPAGAWDFVGEVRFAEGQGMPQRDGRVVMCESAP